MFTKRESRNYTVTACPILHHTGMPHINSTCLTDSILALNLDKTNIIKFITNNVTGSIPLCYGTFSNKSFDSPSNTSTQLLLCVGHHTNNPPQYRASTGHDEKHTAQCVQTSLLFTSWYPSNLNEPHNVIPKYCI